MSYQEKSAEAAVKVVKFGGSSLADAEHFIQVKNIINADPSRKYVVPSAPGKRFKDDEKVTDLFYKCYEHIEAGEDFTEVYNRIKERYSLIIEGLGLNLDMTEEFDEIRSALMHHVGRDYAASRGEYLNGIILAKLLGYDFIDAANVIRFFDNGTFDSETTNTILSAVLSHHGNAVIPGFYGSMPNGTVKTFTRGGSDITGSIVARAASADLYENWTDVSGFLMADPRVVNDPRPIEVITYRELRELSYMGATVLHEDCIFPVRFAGIPINVRNTNKPDDIGTMIVPTCDSYDPECVITGIAGKKGFSTISIEKDLMNSEVGFGKRLLEVLEKGNICFEHLPSGIDTMGVIVSSSELEGRREKLLDEICLAVVPDSITIEDDLALIAVVGRGMVRSPGIAARVFTAVAKENINVRMIDQGSSEMNIILGVEACDFEKAMRVIYEEFVK